MKTHWKNLANYDYLGAYSLEGANVNEITLTIAEVRKERVTAPGGSSEDCVVAYFEENEVNGVVIKPMVLNKTNCKAIASLYSDFIEEWIGKQIIVFATTTKFARETVSCLRVKREKPVVQKKEPHTCIICGTVVEDKMYNQVMEKYGVSVCSKECLEKYKESQNQNQEENK